jgi:hypothetical protein
VGEPVEVRVPIDAAACRAALARPGLHRVLVAITDVWSKEPPGVIYSILVNLPQDPSHEMQLSHRVGAIALYTTRPMPEPGSRMSFDMTHTFARSDTCHDDAPGFSVIMASILCGFWELGLPFASLEATCSASSDD